MALNSAIISLHSNPKILRLAFVWGSNYCT